MKLQNYKIIKLKNCIIKLRDRTKIHGLQKFTKNFRNIQQFNIALSFQLLLDAERVNYQYDSSLVSRSSVDERFSKIWQNSRTPIFESSRGIRLVSSREKERILAHVGTRELAVTAEISARPKSSPRSQHQATCITQLFAHVSDSLSRHVGSSRGSVVLRRIMPVSRNSPAYLHT